MRPQRGHRELPGEPVSIHASSREATRTPRAPWTREHSFNPRLRTGGGHDEGPVLAVVAGVSIYASAREATCGLDRRPAVGAVSIHTPAQEAAPGRAPLRGPNRVSTHATAREATARWPLSTICATFRSTPPHGRRQPVRCSRPTRTEFQSTPLHRRRPFVPCGLRIPSLVSRHKSSSANILSSPQ